MEPLAGIRVLDFSRALAGAGTTHILANYGAEVIRVEWPENPGLDFLRLMYGADGVNGLNRSGLFNTINLDKLSITLNMRRPNALAIAKRLMAISDIFIENMTPGVIQRMGMGYESAKAMRPDLIYLSVSGWGQSGPRKEYRSYGMSSAAHAGVAYMAGMPERPPAGWQFAFCDHSPAWLASSAIMKALHHRRKTSRGMYIDLPQTQASVTFVSPYFLDKSVNGRSARRPDHPNGNRREHPMAAPHNSFRCAGEENWCVIACYTDLDWAGLKSAMGSPQWAEHPMFATQHDRWDHQDEIEQHIGDWTKDKERYGLANLLQQHGVPAGVVQTARDRVEWDAQLEHRGTYQIYHHPEVGPRRYETVAARLSKSPYKPKRPAPLLGQHNDYIFRELLGMSSEELDSLLAEDSIRVTEGVPA